ncbi:MAG: inverse autotransporter beta domain-containing protein [Plesiomonas sp.]
MLLIIFSFSINAQGVDLTPLSYNDLSQSETFSLNGYTLKSGETIESVSKKNNLTVEQLWRFNRNLFSHDKELFYNLGVGSEIMIPSAKLKRSANEINEYDYKFASGVKNAASVLVAEESKSNVAFGYFNSYVNSTLADVLNRNFTAEINVNYDLNAGLVDSSADLLYPLFDDDNNTIFTQFGLRYYDDKSVMNIGFGHRYFESESYLLGYNIFYDQQLNYNQHKRFGLGGEFSSNYVTLNTNLYKGVSGWESSSLLDDYDERVADGFDVIGEYRFKSIPKLSTTFSYEKYFGDEVALFGLNEKQKDPYSVSAGFKYSPMSLVDFNIKHKIGRSGVNDSSVGVTVNYDFNQSLDSQLRMDLNDFIIPFNKDRHSLVKRNNNIALEYKKQDVISVVTNGDVYGNEGDTIQFSIQVNSRYDIKSVNLSHSSLSSNGGSIVDLGKGLYSLQMPLYVQGNNKHKVTVTATDIKGNVSNQETFFAIVSGQKISSGKSTLNIMPARLIADEKSTSKAVVTLLSEQGHPISDAENRVSISLSSIKKVNAKSLSVKKNTLIDPTISSVKEISPGQYEAIITSGNIAGTASVVASIDQISLSSEITFLADIDSAFISEIKESKRQVTADSVDSVDYIIYVKDISNNPITGITINLSTDLNTFTANNSTNTQLITDDQGKAIVSLRGSNVGVAHVVASLADGSSRNANPVTFISGSVSELTSTLLLLKSAILTDGKDNSTLIIRVNDKAGNPVNVDVSSIQLSDLNNNGQVFFTAVEKKQPGVYISSITATSVGATAMANISAIVNDTVLNPASLTLLPAIGSETISSLTANKTVLIADDNDQVQYQVTVKDKNGTAVPDVFVYWNDLSEHGQSTYDIRSKTDSNGVARTLLRTKKSGVITIQATIAGDIQKNNEVTAVSGTVDLSKSTFTSNKIAIGVTAGNMSDSALLSVDLVDKFGNPITQQQVVIQDTAAVQGVTIDNVVEGKLGKYGSTILSTTMGVAKLQASVNGVVLDDKVTITIGAMKPDLKFANAIVTSDYTSNFTGSQAVINAPANVIQRWSSNNEDVATVNSQGQVTLHKAGQATITVSTDPTSVYVAAIASYTLNITRAEPQLRFASPSNESVWNIPYTGFNVIADNSDVNVTTLPMHWTSSNTLLAMVTENTGDISLIKPGTAIITVNSEETDQFQAGTASYSLVITKSRLNIEFASSLQEFLRTDNIVLQQPIGNLPSEVTQSWSSSNREVLSIDSNNVVTVNSVGQVQITLTSQENEYYTQSSGSYSIQIWGKPKLSNIQYSYVNKDQNQSPNGTEWKPTYTTDSLMVSWQHDSVNQFDKPKSIEVKLINMINNQVLDTSGQLSGNSVIHTFIAKSSYNGVSVKNIKVLIQAVTINTAPDFQWQSSNIKVSSLRPEEIWNGVSLTEIIRLKQTDIGDRGIIGDYPNGWNDCRSSFTVPESSLYMDWSVSVNITAGKILLNPLRTLMKTNVASRGHNSPSTIKGSTQINNKDIKSAFSDSWAVTTSSAAHGDALHTLCWDNHDGGVITAELTVTYNMTTYTYQGDKSLSYTGTDVKNKTQTVSFK